MNAAISLTMMTLYLLVTSKPADAVTALLIGAISFGWCRLVDYLADARHRQS